MWADKLLKEFFLQGDAEKMKGWICSPNMDRESTKQEEMSLNFIDYIVAPLFLCLHHFIPNSVQACRCLIENRQKWQEILDESLHLQNEEEKKNRTERVVHISNIEKEKSKSLSDEQNGKQGPRSSVDPKSFTTASRKPIPEVYEQWQVRKAAFEKTVVLEFDKTTISQQDSIINISMSRPKSLPTRIHSIEEGEVEAGHENDFECDIKSRRNHNSTSGIFALQSFVSAQMDMSSSGDIDHRTSHDQSDNCGSFRFLTRKLSSRFLE
uniref:PDEase domain-containing protein n=1 Tax=Aplanochytrium stocchinoi TaxID=215587 RepID=A0A7S3V2K9_9STRA